MDYLSLFIVSGYLSLYRPSLGGRESTDEQLLNLIRRHRSDGLPVPFYCLVGYLSLYRLSIY